MKLTIFSPLKGDLTALPFFTDSVKAGFPSPADDHLERSLDLNELLIKHPVATFFVRVKGESMLGAGIKDGDILIVDRSLKPGDRSVVVAVLNGEFTVKRLRIQEGQTWLMPENPRFKPISINSDNEFEVWGVVTSTIHQL